MTDSAAPDPVVGSPTAPALSPEPVAVGRRPRLDAEQAAELVGRKTRGWPRWIGPALLVAILAVGIWGYVWLLPRTVAFGALGGLEGRVIWSLGNGSLLDGGETQVMLGNAFNPAWSANRLNKDRLRYLTDLPPVVDLDLTNSQMLSERDLGILARLPHLRSLRLGRTRDPRWIVDQEPLHRGDALMPIIGTLTNLEDLDLAGSDVTDAGLPALAGLTRLRFLDLSETRITDAGLAVLAGLPALETLTLDGTKVTPQAVRQLTRSRPEITVDLATEAELERRRLP
jgi:hypothetical protein